MGAHKTKAALQGRQCHYQIHSQDSTAGDPVKCSYGVTVVTKGGIPPLRQNHVVTRLPPYLAFDSRKRCSDKSNGQPFGLASRSKRWRHASLTHELNWPGPAASSICSNSSSSKRMFFAVLLERSNSRLDFFSCIGIYHSCSVNTDGIYHLNLKQDLKKSEARGCYQHQRASDQTVNRGNSYG